MIMLTEVKERGESFTLNSRAINPETILDIQPNFFLKKKLQEGKLADGLNPNHEFSSVTIQKGLVMEHIFVVGSVESINEKVLKKKQLLLG